MKTYLHTVKIKNGEKVLELGKELSKSRKRYLDSLKEGATVEETLKEKREGKTHAQCKAIFGYIISTVKFTLDERGADIGGAPWSESQIADCLYAYTQLKRGHKKTLSTKGGGMDKQEASWFIDDSLWFAANFKDWLVFVPDPRPQGEGKT